MRNQSVKSWREREKKNKWESSCFVRGISKTSSVSNAAAAVAAGHSDKQTELIDA